MCSTDTQRARTGTDAQNGHRVQSESESEIREIRTQYNGTGCVCVQALWDLYVFIRDDSPVSETSSSSMCFPDETSTTSAVMRFSYKHKLPTPVHQDCCVTLPTTVALHQFVATAAALYLSKLSHPGQVLLFHDHDVMLVCAKSGPPAQSVT